MNPLINILIRHKQGREYEFNYCLETVFCQTYKNFRIIFSQENIFELVMVSGTETIHVDKNNHYNLYCNDLKDKVESGYFFFLDDDDYLASPTVLEEVVKELKDEPDGLIVQFLRKGTVKKPTDFMIDKRIIKKGVIGGGCLVLHSKFKNVADWKAKQAADFDWISEVGYKVNLKFCHLVLQIAPNGGNHGK